MLSIASGSVSIYPIYTFYIKDRFNYSLRQINLFASFINIGQWVAFGMGLIYDSFGPKISNVLSLILLPGGFIILYNLIQSTSYISLFWFLLVALIMGQGSSLVYTNALSTTLKNFSKKNSSNLVGLIISNCAIAPSIFASYKTALGYMTIPNFIFYVILQIIITIVFSLCFFDVIKIKNNDEFRDKIYKDFKQKFIIFLFGYANFISLIVFIVILLVNHILGIELPAFLVFTLVHIIFIIFVFLEKFKQFDDILQERFNRSHRNNYLNTFNNNIPGNYYSPFQNLGQRNVEIIGNQKDINKEENNIRSSIKMVKDDVDKNEKNKMRTEIEDIDKIKNKFDFEEKTEKKEFSQDVNINRNFFNKQFENNNSIYNKENTNINNMGEYNNKSNGKISEDNSNDDKKEKEEEDNNNNNNNKEEEQQQQNKNFEEEKNKEENQNIFNDKDEQSKVSNLEESINKINNLKIRESINSNNDNNNINNNNEDSIDNGAKKEKLTINKNTESEEKLDDNTMSYPKFSMNSSNNNNENNNNNKEEIKVENNYPKFSLNSDNMENPYKEEETPKFSINKENNEENLEKIDNNDDNNIDNDNEKKIKQRNSQIISSNNNYLYNEKIETKNKSEDIDINNKHKTIQLYKTPFANNNNLNMIDTNANNNNTTYTSFMPVEQNILFYTDKESVHEEEENNDESQSKFVFLLSLFRRAQIMELFFVLVFTMGCMISNVNNIKFIVSAIDTSKSLYSTSLDKYPLLYFSFNSLTRIIVGRIANEIMGSAYTFMILFSITAIGLISQIFGFFMTKFFIYISISLAGITHGGIMTFVPLYSRYYFSIKNLGTVIGFLTTGNAIGSIIIATLIFPHYYHKHAIIYRNEEYCFGEKCFRISYFINCIFMVIAVSFSYLLLLDDKRKKIKENKRMQDIRKNVSISSDNPRYS